MKKKIISIISVLFLFLFITNVSACFTDQHTYWTATDVLYGSGVITSSCSDRIQQVVDGNFAADQFVVHYFDDNKVGSYISTHTKGSGFQHCLEWAGADQDLICFCYGIGYHNVQDHYAHTYLDNGNYGLDPAYIQKFFSTNFIGHMTIEDSYDIQFLQNKQTDPFFTTGQQTQYTKNLLDTTVFKDNDVINKKYNKYVMLLSRITSMEPDQVLKDANLISNGYKGSGFYNTVYKDKQSIPPIALPYVWAIMIIPLVILFGVMYIPWLLKRQMTRWRFLLYLALILISVIGVLLLVSFYLGSTWQWIRVAVRILPIQVSGADIVYYDNLAKKVSAEYNTNGILMFEDNSGLSYYDSSGIYHKGALQQSELLFYYIGLPILLLVVLSFISFLIFKTFSLKPNRFTRLFNIIGFILFGLLILFIIYSFVIYFIIK